MRILRNGILLLLLYALAAFADVNPGEISNIHVTVTPTMATITWTTAHPGSSWVYWGYHNTAVAVKSGQNDSVTSHSVTLTGLVPYNALAGMGDIGNYDYYVASQRTSDGKWSSSGGPTTNTDTSIYNVHTPALDTSAPLRVSMVPFGQKHVYPGHDLYMIPSIQLLAGGDGAQAGNTLTLVSYSVTKGAVSTDWKVRMLARKLAPSFNPGPEWDGTFLIVPRGTNAGKDYALAPAAYNHLSTPMSMNSEDGMIRVRVPSDAAAGTDYNLHLVLRMYNGWDGTTQQVGDDIVVDWPFTVYPPAAFTAKPPTSFPEIPKLSAWQKTMISGDHGGEYWCMQSVSRTPLPSLEYGPLLGPNYSLVGNFNSAGQFDRQKPYNYDGGRVYIQIADYQFNTPGMPGYHDEARKEHWQHCAQMVLYPYDNWLARSLGTQLNEPNQHLFGTGMYYARTHDPTAAAALAHTTDTWGSFKGTYGTLNPAGMRWFSYTWDSQLAAEASGVHGPWELSGNATDVGLALLDMFMQFDGASLPPTWDYHPYVLGALMEALIGQYELDAEMGRTPDARIPIEIGKTLYFLFEGNNQNWWNSDIGTLRYSPVDVPMSHKWNDPNSTDVWSDLNNLLSPACAWYWSKTGDDKIREWGDQLFAATWKDNGDLAWSAKPFNQAYKWSFDFVRYRSGPNPKATFLPSQNPYEGPWKDTVPPLIFREYNCGRTAENAAALCQDTRLVAPIMSGNEVTLTWDTIKPATTEVYYQTDKQPDCSLKDSYKSTVTSCVSKYKDHYSADPEGVRHHVARLKEAPVGVTVHYVLYSQDAAGNVVMTPDLNFTMPSEKPGGKAEEENPAGGKPN